MNPYFSNKLSFLVYFRKGMSKSGSIKDGEKGPYDPIPTSEKGNDEIKLEAKMSLLNGVTVIVGSIIGSGIFVSPTGVLKYTGSVNASLLVWMTSGIYSMVSLIFFSCYFKKINFLKKFNLSHYTKHNVIKAVIRNCNNYIFF